MAYPLPFRRTPHALRDRIGGLRRRPPWLRSHAARHAHFGAPLTRFVAPHGAPPKARVAPQWLRSHAAPRTHFGAPLTCFVAP